MKNISFDNPYLLLLIIPLLLLIIVPHLIAIRKTNRNISTTLSLILHILIVLAVVPAIAGMKHTTVITKTEVYVVADMSYSADESKDKIDEYIKILTEVFARIRAKRAYKSFGQAFSKACAHPRRVALVALRRARNFPTAFLFCELFLCACGVKEKSG